LATADKSDPLSKSVKGFPKETPGLPLSHVLMPLFFSLGWRIGLAFNFPWRVCFVLGFICSGEACISPVSAIHVHTIFLVVKAIIWRETGKRMMLCVRLQLAQHTPSAIS
jgi:hypothetical protein